MNNGSTVFTDLVTNETLQTFKSSKFVVRVAFSSNGQYLATASYDHHIVIYTSTGDSNLSPQIDEDEDQIPLDETDDILLACEANLRYVEARRIKVDFNPEAILFHPNNHWLLYTIRSSYLLYYINLSSGNWEIKSKSFNPHPMDTHVSFSILNLALHPSGRMIACQTGDHQGGTGERILLYGIDLEETDRLGCIWTVNEGDDFVLPRMTWLPDGSGLMQVPSLLKTNSAQLTLVSERPHRMDISV